MKILAIHNFHRKGSTSGDDQFFKKETKLLEDNDVKVIRYFTSNDQFDDAGAIGKIRMALGMLWSKKHYKNVKSLIIKEKPNIVHIHTFFPLLSPSILYAAKEAGCKVVVTLHDTRFICPCATSLRGTKLCNDCGDGCFFRMIKYKCFKNSKLQSAIVAFIFWYHRKRKTFYNQIDRYICLNDNQIQLLVNIGFDRRKIVKKYNFRTDTAFDDNCAIHTEIPERYVVFYGRIGEEKGIRILMKIWNELRDIPLIVTGGGPLQNEFSEWAKNQKQVFYLGYIPYNECMQIVKNSEFVVFPSIWYEGCSMTVIEAECFGKALVATDLGFSAEAIENGYNGLKIPLGDVKYFVTEIRKLWNSPELCKKMGLNARKDYEAKYMPEDNFKQLISIYENLYE